MSSVPLSKRFISHLILPRDRPLADLSAALSIRKTRLRFVSISLSRLLLSESSSVSPGGPPYGEPENLHPDELVLFEVQFVPVP